MVAINGVNDLFALESVWHAYQACRKRKRSANNTRQYEMHLLDNLIATRNALQQQSYVPSRSFCFVAVKPKAREIHAADFADRVVHHILVPQLEKIYEPIFIHDLYSNRRQKGTHKAVVRLGSFMRSVSDNGNREAFFLQLDIANFFNSIHQPTLWDMMQKRLNKARKNGQLSDAGTMQLKWLTHKFIKYAVSEQVLFRGDRSKLFHVPEHKRLSCAKQGYGLPIGNLTSQFFANVYLNELDQFVKHELKCQCYLRFVDDFVLVSSSKKQLELWLARITLFLDSHLQLQLKQAVILKSVNTGADFLGYIVRPHYNLVRRRVIGNLRHKLNLFQNIMIRNNNRLLLKREHRDKLQSVMASYMGHLKHASHFRLMNAILMRYPWLGYLYRVENSHWEVAWEPKMVTSLRQQWLWFVRRYPGFLILIQVGNRVEIYLDSSLPLSDKVKSLFRADTKPRLPFASSSGIAIQNLKFLFSSLQQQQQPCAFIIEAGYLQGGMKRRLLHCLYHPEIIL